MIWGVAVPAWNGLYGEDIPAMNAAFAKLSTGVFLSEPRAFASWMIMAFWHSFRRAVSLSLDTPLAPANVLLTGLFTCLRFACRNR